MFDKIKLESRFLVITLLLFLSFNSYTYKEAKAQLCPFTTVSDGVIKAIVQVSSADAMMALLGTFDRLNAFQVNGGIDWFYSNKGNFETTIIGAQLVTWWTLKNEKNTSFQVTNADPSDSVNVHVQIFNGRNCTEILDFCDLYTPKDTHTYDLDNLVTNSGLSIPTTQLRDKEGFIVVTPVTSACPASPAIAFPNMYGSTRILDSQNRVGYGVNMYARDIDTIFDCSSETAEGHKILNGDGDCKFVDIAPTSFPAISFSHVFSTLPNSTHSRSDVVFIAFSDDYSPRYQPSASTTDLGIGMLDVNENPIVCTPITLSCFFRDELNESLPSSDSPLPGSPFPLDPPPTMPGPPFDPPVPPGPPLPPPK